MDNYLYQTKYLKIQTQVFKIKKCNWWKQR